MEISSMIKTIQQETMEAVGSMEHGVQAVAGGATGAARSGEALQEILEQINAVTAQVNQIAVAAEEQTATTEEINRSIQQISDVIGETAAGARDSSSSATRMKELAEELHRMVSRFKLIA